MIRGCTGVTTKQFSTVFTHSAELHMVILLILSSRYCVWYHIITLLLKVFKVFFFCLPLYSFFLLTDPRQQINSVISLISIDLCQSKYLTCKIAPFMRQTYAVWTAPLALRSSFQFRLQTHKMVGSRTCVTQNDFPTLLAHFTVVLMICFITIALIISHNYL